MRAHPGRLPGGAGLAAGRAGIGTALQIAISVFGSMALAILLIGGVWLYLVPEPLLPPPDLLFAARAGMLLRTLSAMPADQDAALVAANNAAGHVSCVTKAAPPPMRALTTPYGSAFQRFTVRESGLDAGLIAVGMRPQGERGEDLVVVGQFGPAAWLVCDHGNGVPHRGKFKVAFLVSILLLIAVPLALMSLWSARSVTNPLVRLAAATEGYEVRADLPPANVLDGTREVRQVARAFNTILDRLARFILDRTRMLAAISHDLRTPLTRIRLRVETLEDPDLRARLLHDVATMDAMLASTLSFIRDEATHERIERVDLAVLTQTICDQFADAGQDVAYAGPLHQPGLCRPLALERALNNVIENAIKFGSAAAVTLAADGADTVIDVDDSGPGIPEDQKDDVFKPFFRGDAARGEAPGGGQGGTGLGLAIARAIIRAHGGEVALLDRSPRGLRVRLTLPGETAAA